MAEDTKAAAVIDPKPGDEPGEDWKSHVNSPEFAADFHKAFTKDQPAEPPPDPALATPAESDPKPGEKDPPADPSPKEPDSADPDAPKPGSKEYNWAQVKKAKADLESELSSVKARLADAENKAKGADEVESLRKERDELRNLVRVLDLQSDPQFKAAFDDRISREIQKAKTIVGGEDADKLASLLSLPDSQSKMEQIGEIIEKLSPIQQTRIGPILNSIADIEYDRGQELQRARENREYIETAQRQQREQRTQAMWKTFDSAVDRLRSDQNPLSNILKPHESDTAWNQGLESRLEMAKKIFSSDMPDGELAMHAVAAANVPVFIRMYQNAVAKVEELQAWKDAHQSASPKPGEGGEPGRQDSGSDDNDFSPQAVERRARGIDFSR